MHVFQPSGNIITREIVVINIMYPAIVMLESVNQIKCMYVATSDFSRFSVVMKLSNSFAFILQLASIS